MADIPLTETGNGPASGDQMHATEEHPMTPLPTTTKGKKSSVVSSKGRKCLLVILGIVLLLLLLGGIVILVLLLLFVGRQPPRVLTTYGTYEGLYHLPAEVFSFKGIPYAMPPTGERRWQPPVAFDSQLASQKVIDAKEDPPECKQQGSHSTTITGDEDCLYLNVFTPEIDPAASLPVMVYIHGGYLQWGNASQVGYCPDQDTAKMLDVVMVSIQYRLNAFGFLVLDALPGRIGNYGLLDQIEALKWVKANIRNFGGDPEHVTVFGQSSGGTSIFGLLTTPKATGLFHKAWIISGSPVFDSSLEDAAKANNFFLNRTGCNTEKCLMELGADQVVGGIYPEWDPIEDSMDLPTKDVLEYALLVVDGDTFPMAPFEMWDKQISNISDVPLVVGTTAQELDIFPWPQIYIKYWNLNDVRTYVESRLSPFGASLPNESLALYHNYNSTAEYLFTTMASDVRMTCGNDVMTQKAASALTKGVYRYVVTSFPSSPAPVMGFPAIYAFHTWDIYAFFDNFQYVLSGETRDSDRDFGEIMRRNMMNFVRNGVPSDSSWKSYPENTALISDKFQVVKTYHKDQCEFWINNNFFKYSWVN